MSFTGGTQLGSAYGSVKIGSDLKGIDAAEKSLTTFQKQAESAAKKISAQFKAIGDAAKRAGQALSITVTAPLVLAGKKAVSAASDLNEALSAVDVIFGDASDSVKAFAEDADKNLGLSEEAALSAATQFAGLAKQANLTGVAAADFSDQLLQNSADLASFFNTDPSEALDALRSGLIGESEPLRRYNILIDEAAVKQKGLELGLTDVNGEMSQGAKVVARYALIQEQMGAATGDFARTSGGLANSLRIARAEAVNIAATVGQVLLPIVLNGVQAFIRFAEQIKTMSPEMQRLVVIIGTVAAAAGPALIAFGQLVNVFSKAGAAVALLTGPLGLVVAAIALLVTAWKQNWGDIQTIVGNAVDTIGSTIGRMIQFFTAAKERGLDPFHLALRTLIVVLGERIGKDSPIVEALQGVLRNGQKLADWINQTFLPVMGNAVDALKGGDLQDLPDIFGEAFVDIKNGFDRHFGPFLDSLKELGGDVLGGVIAGIKEVDWDQVGDEVGGAIQSGLSVLSNFGSWVLDAIKGVGSGGGGGATGRIAQLGPELTGFLSDRFSEVDWDKLGDDLIGGMQRAVTIFLDFQKWRFEKLLQLGQFIADRIAEVDWPSVGGKILDAWRPAWDTFMQGVRTDGAKIAGQVLDGVKSADWDSIGKQAQDSLQGALAFLNQLGTWIKEQLAGINWDDVGSFLADKIEGAVNGIYAVIRRNLQTLQNFGSWVRDELTKASYADVNKVINDKGAEIFNSLIAGLNSKLTDLQKWVQDRSDDLQRFFQNASTLLLTRGQEIVTGLQHGAQDFFNNKFGPWLQGAIKTIGSPTLFTDAIAALLSRGQELIDGLRHGAQDFFNNQFGPNFLEKLPTMISDGIGSLLETLKQAGIDLITGLGTGAKQQFDQFVKDLQGLINGINLDWSPIQPPAISLPGTSADPNAPINNADASRAARGQASDFREAGQDAATGYAQGLQDGQSDVEQAGRDLAATAVGGTQEEQQSASPSKVFEGLGRFAGQGYINGITAMTSAAQTAGKQLAGAADSGATSVIDTIKTGLGNALGGILGGFGQIAGAAETSAESAAASQKQSDAERVQSAQDTTDAMTGEEAARAAIAGGVTAQTAADQKEADQKRLEAEHDYARASIGIEQDRAKAIKDANSNLEKSLHDLNVRRLQSEHTLAQSLKQIDADRIEAEKQAESDLADLQDQRAEAQANFAKQKAGVEQQLQEQLSEAEKQFNADQQDNLQQQQEARAQLAEQLKEAAAAWKEADAAAVEQIKNIREELKKTLQQGREEFNKFLRDNTTDTDRLNEDFQRDLQDLDVQRQRVNEDLQAALVDPSLSPEQRAQKRIDAARALQDLDRQQQDLEIQHQRDLQDAEQARDDAEKQHIADEQAAKQAAHDQIMDQKKAEKQAEQDYHDTRVNLENDAAKQIGDLQKDLATAATDLRATQAGLRDDAVNQINDLADQEKNTMADLRDREKEIFDTRAQNYKDLEAAKTQATREAEHDRTIIARDEQNARDLDARTQQQAERDAQREQRKALRQLNSDEDVTDKGLAHQRGTDLGTEQGTGISEGLTDSKPAVQSATADLASAAGAGFNTEPDAARTLGVNWVTALVAGIRSQVSAATAAGSAIATAADTGFRDEADQHSPSRKAFDLGATYGKSISLGILSQRQQNAAAVASLLGSQDITRAGLISQITADRQRALMTTPTLPSSLQATVVIEDKGLKQVILGTAIAPLIGSRDRASGSIF